MMYVTQDRFPVSYWSNYTKDAKEPILLDFIPREWKWAREDNKAADRAFKPKHFKVKCGDDYLGAIGAIEWKPMRGVEAYQYQRIDLNTRPGLHEHCRYVTKEPKIHLRSYDDDPVFYLVRAFKPEVGRWSDPIYLPIDKESPKPKEFVIFPAPRELKIYRVDSMYLGKEPVLKVMFYWKKIRNVKGYEITHTNIATNHRTICEKEENNYTLLLNGYDVSAEFDLSVRAMRPLPGKMSKRLNFSHVSLMKELSKKRDKSMRYQINKIRTVYL